jgi:hypothetical protein
MGKFKDKRGHTRWQEAKSDVKQFLDKHGDDIAPVAKAVVKIAIPRVANVIDLIDAVKTNRKGSATERDKAVAALETLLDDLDDDEDQGLRSEAMPLEGPANTDLLKLVNSTWASKYIGPVVMILMTILFFATWSTEIVACWGFSVKPVPVEDKATISLVFSTLFGIRQLVRNDAKKKILSV